MYISYQKKTDSVFSSMKTSKVFLILGMLTLLVGAVLAILDKEPVADYVLVVGAVLIIFRGAFRARERDDAGQAGQ